MAHVRTQLRTALATLLLGLATTADRVFKSRVTPFQRQELPALSVAVEEEEISLGTVTTAVQISRRVTARITGHAGLADGVDDELDQIALEVEQKIATDDTLGGLINEPLLLTGIEAERSGEGDVPVGRITLTYATTYETTTAAPDAAL